MHIIIFGLLIACLILFLYVQWIFFCFIRERKKLVLEIYINVVEKNFCILGPKWNRKIWNHYLHLSIVSRLYADYNIFFYIPKR